MTNREALQEASKTIQRRDAETLLLHVVGRDRPWLLAYPDAEVGTTHSLAFSKLVSRRADRVPLQYLTGHQEFFGLDLQVTPDVLIPRPETELLVQAVLDWAAQATVKVAPSLSLVDVGTGSGAIALALATELPQARVQALDISRAALGVAEGNASRLNLHARVRFRQSDLLEALLNEPGDHKFDAIVSNPPYVPIGEAPSIQAEVRDHEPHLALFAGQDGLELYRRLIPQAWDVLRPGGLLALEFGFGQKCGLGNLLTSWTEVQFKQDYAAIPRIALALRP